MTKIDDMELFVQVVKAGGLAAAGKKLGLSPASMTARISQIEQRYGTRLLTRNTRSIALTELGKQFFEGCLRVIEEVEYTENLLHESQASIRGSLRVSATSDFGRQYVAPALAEFSNIYPNISPYLMLSDGLINLIDQGVDVAFRFGNLPDSNLISRPFYKNRRVLCASPRYIESYGEPLHPRELIDHHCIVLERQSEVLNEWFFEVDDERFSLKVKPYLSCSDGEVVRRWALHGHGIALKSLVDVRDDVKNGELILLLNKYTSGFSYSDSPSISMQAIYPSRKYQPVHVKAFIDFFENWFDEQINKN